MSTVGLDDSGRRPSASASIRTPSLASRRGRRRRARRAQLRVLHGTSQGFEGRKRKPDIGTDSTPRGDHRSWSNAPTIGHRHVPAATIFPHGYNGKAGEMGLERSDIPKELAGKV